MSQFWRTFAFIQAIKSAFIFTEDFELTLATFGNRWIQTEEASTKCFNLFEQAISEEEQELLETEREALLSQSQFELGLPKRLNGNGLGEQGLITKTPESFYLTSTRFEQNVKMDEANNITLFFEI